MVPDKPDVQERLRRRLSRLFVLYGKSPVVPENLALLRSYLEELRCCEPELLISAISEVIQKSSARSLPRPAEIVQFVSAERASTPPAPRKNCRVEEVQGQMEVLAFFDRLRPQLAGHSEIDYSGVWHHADEDD